ncbi:MAG: phenylalanine--tRNA ligase beta subunit-related protein [Saprospiraceae bacterium]
MKIPPFSIDEIIRQRCPNARLGCLLMAVKVAPSSPELLQFIQKELTHVQEKLVLENIHDLPPLHAAREAYKSFGKDPSRYRPSAEALLRRVVQGKGLYQINNVVDALNLVSAKSGFSIGGYDCGKISGDIRFGKGEANEPYEAIGRGVLNIDGLPVLRDEICAFGSPTSDSQRTMVSASTHYFLVVFFDFGGHPSVKEAMGELEKMIADFSMGALLDQKILM